MDGKLIENNSNYSHENIGDWPRSALSYDKKIPSTSSSKKRRGSIQKRVVSVPIKEVEGVRLKGDHMSSPPSDSWAWRKYGQKPIKGSPYPRGYYRCSSFKGCPAKKQVERSRLDPNMVLITYSCEHNHPWPRTSPSYNTTTNITTATTVATSISEEEEEEEEEKKPLDISTTSSSQIHEHGSEYKFINILGDVPLINNPTEFGWFTDFDPTSCSTMLLDESSYLIGDERVAKDNYYDEMSMIFTMREEDEPLFADLGELPECSTVFLHGMAEREATNGGTT